MEKCGSCDLEFADEQAYLDHTCSSTGFTPRDVAHQDALTDGQFSKQAEAALARGAARQEA